MVVEMLSDLTEEAASEPSDFDLDNYLDIVQQEQDQDLYLDNRNLSTLPSKLLREAAAFTQLTRLHLRNNNLDTLPNEIGKLTGLLELNVHDNKLKELPKGIGSLNILETLDVSSNLLSHLPSCIGRLNSLDSLLVSDNKLVAIPKEVCTLRSLRVLSAMNNKIRSLPLEIALCCSLTRLLLDRNCLRWLPRELCALPHLEEISVCKNQLLCLPIDLGTASRLKSVYLDNNAYLHAVPISISPLEVGFHSCGMDNYKPVDFEEEYYNYITVDGDEAEPEKKIFVPLEMKVLGKKQSFLVPSLLEISLKAVERYHKKDKPYPPIDLPLGLHLTLSAPVATCTMCHAPIYTSAYPVLFEAQIHLYRLLRLVLCCSSGCVFRAARYTVLPLVYPDPDLLLMTVALVQN